MNNRLEAAKGENKKLRDQIQEVQASLDAEKAARPDNVRTPSLEGSYLHLLTHPQEERSAALAQLSSLKAQLTGLEDELAKYGACDPIKIEAKRRACELAHEATVRWTGMLS